MSMHHEWLSLIEISGPFLAIPVLKEAFPQGLEELDAGTRKRGADTQPHRTSSKGTGLIDDTEFISARIPRRDLSIDVDPNALDLCVLAHGIKAHLAPVARGSNATEWRTRVDALVAVDPDHAALHLAGELVCPLQVVGPQATAQTVFGSVCDLQRFLVVLERDHRDKGAKHLLLSNAIFPGASAYDGRFDIAPRGQITAWCPTTGQRVSSALPCSPCLVMALVR